MADRYWFAARAAWLVSLALWAVAIAAAVWLIRVFGGG